MHNKEIDLQKLQEDSKALLDYVVKKYNITSYSEFTCEHMRSIAQNLHYFDIVLPRYSFVQFLAACESEDFFDPDVEQLASFSTVVQKILYNQPLRATCEYCDKYCNNTEMGSLLWLQDEFRSYTLYSVDPARWLADEWDSSSVAEFRQKFSA